MIQRLSYESLKSTKKTSSFWSIGLLSMLFCFGTQLAMANLETSSTKLIMDEFQSAITGTITDSSGTPLPGANVIIAGTTTGTVADFDGNYSINASSGDVLVFSYTGFNDARQTVGTQSQINVTLEEGLALDEVIVVAYGTTTKKDLTGAVGVISGDDLTQFPATTIDQALQGKTAGVQIVSNSGAPGASVTVNIRGTGSFASTTPLYIVDGYPTQDISYLSPSNIQSISVLKDASAGAIYGVRAANGVVIIETKKGTNSGKVTFEIDSWAGFRTQPEFLDVLDAQTFAGHASQLVSTENDLANNEINSGLYTSYYPGWDNPQSLQNINWQDYAFNSGFRTGTNITVRGGGENSRVAFNAGMIQEDGIVVGSSYDRYTMGLNAQFDVSDKFRVKADLKYAYTESVTKLNQGYYNIVKLVGNIPHLAGINEQNINGGINLTNLPYDGQGNYGAYPDVSNNAFRGNTNVIGNALRNESNNGSNNILVNMTLEYDLFPSLTAKINTGGNINVFSGNNFNPSYYSSFNNVDLNESGDYDVQSNVNNEILAEALLVYSKEFGNHKIDILGGLSTQRNHFKRVRSRASDFLNDAIRDIAQGADVTNSEGYTSTTTLASTFARLNYNFNSKYYITGTIRRDGVGDRFGENELWGTFTSFATGWNIDEEDFMNNSAFDVLKLRASWGETGSFTGIDSFLFDVIYAASNNGNANDTAGYDFGGQGFSGLYPRSLPNPNLKWETQIQTNIGLEAELLDRRLYITADWFKKESSDFLFNETIPLQNGFTSRAVNSGSVVNKGLELLVGYRKFDGEFTWDVSANITLLDNEITALTSTQDFYTVNSAFVPTFAGGYAWEGLTRSVVGGEVGSFYGFRADGIFQTQAEIDALNAAVLADPNNDAEYYQREDTSPGDRKFKDLNGDGSIDEENDREVLGSPIPDFFGGLNLNFSYKNFDLGIDLYGSYGSEIMNFVRVELETSSTYGNGDAFSNIGTDYYNGRWTGEGTSNTYARAIGNDGLVGNGRASDYFMEDGSYLRLRNLKLGYNLPSSVTDAIGMSSAKIYLSSQNLITWTKYSGWDPEVGQNSDLNGANNLTSRGVDSGQYPNSTSFTFGVNLKF